jgi:2-dehydro-3-deoxy-D-arabinonate dehydratase
MKRGFEDLVAYLFREMSFPNGVFLMSGTGVIPEENFNLQHGDVVRVTINQLVLENEVFP